MSLGERLRSLRIKNKLTQSELAENIMATNTSISNLLMCDKEVIEV